MPYNGTKNAIRLALPCFLLAAALVSASPRAFAASIVSYNPPSDSAADVVLTQALNFFLTCRLETFPGFPLADETPSSALSGIDMRKIWEKSDKKELEDAFAAMKSGVFLIGRHVESGGKISSTIKIYRQDGARFRVEQFSSNLKSGGFQAFLKSLTVSFFRKMEGRAPKGREADQPPAPTRQVFDTFAEAVELMNSGKVNAGTKKIDVALKSAPGYRDALYFLGKSALLQTFEYERANEKFRRIVKQNPADAPAWFWLGLSNFLKSDYQAAIEAFENARKHKTDAGIYSYLATVYQEARKYDLAIENYNRALKLSPRNASMWYQLAGLYARLGMRVEAFDALRKTLSIDAAAFLPIAATDTDFARWRKDDEFKKLLESYKK